MLHGTIEILITHVHNNYNRSNYIHPIRKTMYNFITNNNRKAVVFLVVTDNPGTYAGAGWEQKHRTESEDKYFRTKNQLLERVKRGLLREIRNNKPHGRGEHSNTRVDPCAARLTYLL